MANSTNSLPNHGVSSALLLNQPDPGSVPTTALIKAPMSALVSTALPQPVAARLNPLPFPQVLRIESIVTVPVPSKSTYTVTAVLFHESASLRVTWTTRQPDTRMRNGSLAQINRAKTDIANGEGALIIDRLVLLESPDAATNLFKTIPHAWVKDRHVVAQAAAMWDFLPRPLAHLMNAIFWDGERFKRYVRCPSSIDGHHNRPNGNLEHSVDVVNRALGMAGEISIEHANLLIFGGLMHDAGKADEYDPKSKEGNYCRTKRGVMVGHKQTLIEWMAVARRTDRVILSDDHYLLISNMLNSNRHAPEYLGIPKPVSELAGILSSADRVSGDSDNFTRFAPRSVTGGLGKFHPHLKSRSFALAHRDTEKLRNQPAANDPEFGQTLSLMDRIKKGFTSKVRAIRRLAGNSQPKA